MCYDIIMEMCLKHMEESWITESYIPGKCIQGQRSWEEMGSKDGGGNRRVLPGSIRSMVLTLQHFVHETRVKVEGILYEVHLRHERMQCPMNVTVNETARRRSRSWWITVNTFKWEWCKQFMYGLDSFVEKFVFGMVWSRTPQLIFKQCYNMMKVAFKMD